MQLGGLFTLLFEQDGQNQSSRVVIGAIAVGMIRNRIDCVLHYTCRITEAPQVIELQLGQRQWLLIQRPNCQRLKLTAELLPSPAE